MKSQVEEITNSNMKEEVKMETKNRSHLPMEDEEESLVIEDIKISFNLCNLKITLRK